MEDMKVKVTLELSVSAEECKANGVSMQEVVDALVVETSDVIDGFEIFPRHPELNIVSDFVLNTYAIITSVEVVQ